MASRPVGMGLAAPESSGLGISDSGFSILRPTRNEKKKICVKLALKSQMTKLEARKRCGPKSPNRQEEPGGGVLKTTLSPLSGSFATAISRYEKETGGRETAKEKMAQIEIDLIASWRVPAGLVRSLHACKRM